jgi:adenosylhomocysteine nucleosidase
MVAHISKTKIGIMGAMPEEIATLKELLSDLHTTTLGDRVYYSGKLHSVETVVVFSRWGKVAAATTVTTLIHHFGITELIFTGVAGAIHPELNIGDMVIGKRLIQHDMDARPLMPQFEIPLLGKTFFDCHPDRITHAKKIIERLLSDAQLVRMIDQKDLDAFGIRHPQLWIGDIASGDQFFSSHEAKLQLRQLIPSVVCVEMEGAAVAQVCFEYRIPFTIIRTISDVADEHAPIDFPLFIERISSHYSRELIQQYFQNIPSNTQNE